jgi:hypothetical protein
MSAFMVSKAHIDYMVAAALSTRYGLTYYWQGRRYDVSHANASEAGRMLWLENLASIKSRYPKDGDGKRPGPNGLRDEQVEGYSYRNGATVVNPVVILKQIACYEYQSCEHEEWSDSKAAALCDALRKAWIHALPGFEDAPWGL